MTDTDTPGPGADAKEEPQSSQGAVAPAAAEREVERSQDSWFDRLRQAVGLKPANTLRADIEDALEGGGGELDFSDEERQMLRNLLRLREVRVGDVMVPRADILALDVNMTIGEALKAFRESGHSRMPVYRESLDDPIGMIHVKDLMDRIVAAADGDGLDLSRVDLDARLSDGDLVRRVLFVPPSMRAATLLATMRADRVQMALVIDEYGGTDGLVSLEDVVEIVFGEIEDEHDEEEAPQIVPEPDGSYLVDARADLDDFETVVGCRLDIGSEHDDVDTVGGFVFTLLGRIPPAGERIAAPGGLEFEILDSDHRRVKRLRVRRLDAAAA